ncbi:hypothetical protein [Secundilactobacillus malefermentans]|uniref:Uncharacterized protein n=1 Tax=Secundilactobacillus malefermentans TaxID=176292 RepID=A0A4R5ND51_9LACO|nr:hypothetical protein [Secundilactobacillus malefermentans]KRM58611.1 hypothetical protein FD44_GL000498 [Secundilactobacillus malefermentans DSM 5705 = KCTC 3548]QEA31066.1 hypothetical protein FGL90_02190 [Secundilactobacillus malefermentans]TDG71140.1 hypothetical protein C5L31_001827 [Secundilactobacillus malefermentans]
MAYYLCAAFTLISALVSLGFSIDAYHSAQPETALTNAKYALSRSTAIALIMVGLILIKSTPALMVIALIMIIVQLLDGLIGIKISLFKAIGPLVTAIVNAVLLAVLWL